MTKRIGILAQSLYDPYPRGVHRVARAIAQQLVSHAPDEFQLYCLHDRVPNQPEIIYNAIDLSDWLATNPLRIRSTPIVQQKIRRIIGLCCPPLLRYWILSCHTSTKRLWTTLLLDSHLAQSVFAPLRLLFPTAVSFGRPTLAAPGIPMALTEFDLVISADIFEELWDLPIENYSTKTLAVFYDAIPRRIREGSYRNSDHFDSCLSKCALKADKIICISASSQSDIIAYCPVSKGKTTVIHLGHDIERFRQPHSKPTLQNTLAKFGIDPEIPYFLSLGTVEPRKNIVNILRACEILRRRNMDFFFQLVFVGSKVRQPGLRQLLKNARRHLPVIVTNYADDEEVALLLSGAKAFLYPSLWEGFGIPPLEAMSAGTLVVASDVSSLPEVCGDSAVYCDPYDADDIADAISSCAEISASESEERIQKGKEHAAHFTWERMGKQVVDLVEEMLSEPAKRDHHPSNGRRQLGGYQQQPPTEPVAYECSELCGSDR